MSQPLDPTGIPVVIGDLRLTTPGLTGIAQVQPPSSPGTRAAEEGTPGLYEGLRAGGLTEAGTVVLSETTIIDGRGGTRGVADDSAIVLDAPAPGEGFGQVVLYMSEDGGFSWHLPQRSSATSTRGTAYDTFRIPRAVPQVDSSMVPAGSRGLAAAIGKKLLKLLVFPIIDPLIGRVAQGFVANWEAKNHRPRLREVTTATLTQDDVPDLDPAAWTAMDGKRALLLVHGTFSRTPGAFGHFGNVLSQVSSHYDKVIALDHPSVAISPSENIAWLADQLPTDVTVQVDVVTHSRGGLVGRALAEHGDALGIAGRMPVRRLVMVAPPNAGTALADTEKISGYLDRMTTLLQVVPNAGVADTLACIISVVKEIAVAAARGLRGLASMDPSGDPLRQFNAGPRSSEGYRVIVANYEPRPGSPFFSLVRDAGTDLVFGSASNDLVVPTTGAYDVPGAAGFPIAEQLIIAATEGVDHCAYFGRADVDAALVRWLTAP